MSVGVEENWGIEDEVSRVDEGRGCDESVLLGGDEEVGRSLLILASSIAFSSFFLLSSSETTCRELAILASSMAVSSSSSSFFLHSNSSAAYRSLAILANSRAFLFFLLCLLPIFLF